MHATAKMIYPDKSTALEILALFMRREPNPIYSLVQVPQGWQVKVGAHAAPKAKSKVTPQWGYDLDELEMVTITLPLVKRTHLTVVVMAGEKTRTLSRALLKNINFHGTSYNDKKITFSIPRGYAKQRGLFGYSEEAVKEGMI